jgi:hypothetical protein
MPDLRALAVVVLATTAIASTTASVAHALTSRPVAIWAMNESSGSRVMLDVSGHGLTGSVGREVLTRTTLAGATGYRFPWLEPDTPPTHPEHLVTVADSPSLDPGTRDYAVTVRFLTTYRFGNIVQKGQSTVAGGSFKVQVPNGVAQCFFRGSAGQLGVSSGRALNDGRWHTVRCERTATRVTMTVDGVVAARRSGATGTISNSWPLTIGGKPRCDQVTVTCDYYPGYVDYVEIDAG